MGWEDIFSLFEMERSLDSMMSLFVSMMVMGILCDIVRVYVFVNHGRER